MAVVGRRDILDLLQRLSGAGRAGKPMRVGGRKLTARSISFFVEIVLVAVFGVLLGLIFLSLFAPLALPEDSNIADAPSTGQNSVPLIVKSPFPAKTLEAAPLELAPVAVETTLDLTLTGVWANPEGGSATIRLPDGAEKRFIVGEEIMPSVSLSAVYPDRVTLNSGGVRETLRFTSKTPRNEPAPKPTAANRQQLSLIAARVGQLASVLRFAPSMDIDGNFAIELYAARDRRTFAALGLQDGDRLVSINGTAAPNNPAALGSLLSEMQQNNAARIVVERGGKEIQIQISVDQLGTSDVE